MARNPFEGMNFSDAAAEFEEQGGLENSLPQAQTDDTDGTTSNPFEGMTFSEAAAEYGKGRQEEMTDPMRKLLGLPTSDMDSQAATDNISQALQEGGTATEALDAELEQQQEQKAEEVKEARKEVAGAPGDFVSGREQIPFNVSPHKEELRRQIDEGNTDLRHKIKLMGESFALSTADFIDFIREAPNTLNLFSALLPEGATKQVSDVIEINGQSVELGPNFNEGITNILKDTYEVLGMDPEFEKVESGSDIFASLLAQNLGGSAVFGVGKKVVDTASKVPSAMANFLKTELGISVAGATTGTAAAEVAGGSIEDRENIAQVGNMVGVFGAPFVQNLPTIKAARTVYKKVAQAKGFMDSDNAYSLAKDRVHRYLASFVPETEIPKIEQRMELVRRIQKIEPEFKPTVGNVVGTEETRLIQRITDAKNHKKATDQYLKTKAAVERLTERLRVETDPAQKAEIATALNMFSNDALLHVQRLADRIGVLEASGRRVRRGDTSGVEAGTNIREELNNLKKSYEEAMDFVYSRIDPEHTAKFDARGLISKVRSLAKDTSDLDLILDEQDTGFGFVTKVLPKYISKLAKRDGDVTAMAEEAGIILPAGAKAVTQKEIPYVSFEELKKLTTSVNKRAARIARQDPSSNAPAVLRKIAGELDDMVDNRMLRGDSLVRQRYEEATEFAKAEFYTRFRSGVGGTLLRENPDTGDYFVKADDIGPMFWRAGPKEANIEEFKKLFNVDQVKLSGKVPDTADPNKLKEMADAASEIARENLKSYAIRTLQDDLDKAPNKSSIQVLQQWKAKYKGVLSSFDDISKEVDDISKQFVKLETEKQLRTERINKINKEIIENYSGTQESTVLDRIFNDQISVEDAGKFVDDIYVATARKTGQPVEGSDAFTLLYPDIQRVDMNSTDIIKMQNALRNSVASELVTRAYDPKLEGPSWTKFDKLLNGSPKLRNKMEKIFGAEGLSGLDDFGKALRLMGTENKPVTLRELNELKDFMNKLGFSPASVLSRYYSHALGKVGPVYLATDAFTRLFTGVSQKHFDRVYAETMYDLDGLEAVLKNIGDENNAQFIANTKSLLKKQGVAGLKALGTTGMQAFFNNHMIINYGRGLDFGDELDEMRARRDKEKSINDLMEWYLDNNDGLTGQPSRLRAALWDRDTLLEETDDLDAFEKEIEGDESNPIDFYNKTFLEKLDETLPEQQEETTPMEEGMQEVPDIIKNTFEQSGLDKELGLTMAMLESSLKPTAKAGTSSAEGLFQFIDSTWDEMVERHGSKHNITPETADKFDPEQNAKMGAEFLKENISFLQKAGHEGSDYNLYMAHFLGAKGADRFLDGLKERPDQKASDIVGNAAVEANPQIFRIKEGNKWGRERTLQEVMETIQQKVDRARKDIQSFLETPEDGTTNV